MFTRPKCDIKFDPIRSHETDYSSSKRLLTDYKYPNGTIR